MKIKAIRSHLLEKKLEKGMRISRGGFTVRHHCIVEVITDEGVVGLGEGIGTAKLIHAILPVISEWVIGKDPTDIEQIRKHLFENQVYFELKGSVVCAASAIEMACWDILGKIKNVPVWKLLNSKKIKNELALYASNVYWEESPSDMVTQVEEILKQGIKTIKAHIGAAPPDKEQPRIEAMLASLKNTGQLMLDLNAGYDFEAAQNAFKLWDKYDLYWIEEPLSPFEQHRNKELKKLGRHKIAGGENEFRLAGFSEAINKNCFDYVMPDLGRAGGLIESKNICELAIRNGLIASPHCYSSGVLLAATIHMMAATEKVDLLEWDASNNAVYHDFFVTPLEVQNGLVKIPENPGFGIELSQSILKHFKIA